MVFECSAASVVPTALRGAHTETRSISSHGDAESAEVWRVDSGFLALRRLRGVFRALVMWWFVPGEAGFTAWSLPRPAGCAAG